VAGNVRELAHELDGQLCSRRRGTGFSHLPLGEVRRTGGRKESWLVKNYRFPEQGFELEEAIDRLMHMAL